MYGPVEALDWYRQRLGMQHIPMETIEDVSQSAERRLNIIPTPGEFSQAEIGRPTAASGQCSLDALTAAFTDVHSGAAQALVTAPISKEAIGMAGSSYHGHTEMLADYCGRGDNVIMILSSNTMNVGLVTAHIPLREVASNLTSENVTRSIRLGASAMEVDFGIASPRLAVLALNPHAGDGGYLGGEEADLIIPALEACRATGIEVDGPFAADGFFSAHNKTMYDLIIAMYHDQGLVPFKMQAKGRGVNISSGLPIVRTSPDHGTAFGIASHGLASAESMKEAVLAARRIALNRRQ